MLFKRTVWIVLTALGSICLFFVGSVQAAEPVWKTAYYKRGFVGSYQSGWAGGLNASILARTPMAFAGTQAQISVKGCWDQPSQLTSMSLVRGVDNIGHTEGSEYPVTFAGSPTLSLAAQHKTAISDAIPAPLTQGTWYVKDSYTAAIAPAYFPYANEVDSAYLAATLSPMKGIRTGIANRIDVLTTDPRKSLVCFGDSITAGYTSTPNTGHRYPEILSALTNRPVLNLGVNGDLLTQNTYTSSSLISSLTGVGGVVYLMGINDLIGGQITTLSAFTNSAQILISQNRAAGRKVYWGTIPPAMGYPGFNTTKEALRQDINSWIRTQSGADGVIDFDLALCDPADPARLLPAYQSDWLHPNDAGYQKMAETAAPVVSTFPTWVTDNDLSGNDALPGADPDGNGINNLAEYALGIPHGSGTLAGLPTADVTAGALTITFSQLRADVTYQPEWSDDLSQWYANGLTASTTATTTESSIALGASGRRFLRLKFLQQ